MVIVVENEHDGTSSNPRRDDCISHSPNPLGKGMNPTILPPAMGKIVGQPWWRKTLEFKPVKLRLKIDLVSYPAPVEGLVNMVIKC